MDFMDHAGLVCGVDLDHRVLDNPFPDEARVGDVVRLPWADATFDVVISNNVLEHLSEPTTVFSEVCRVLKPGGTFFAKTPGSLHYVPLIARCTPHRFHVWFNRKRGRAESDTFLTLYRINSPHRIRKCCTSAGLIMHAIRHVEGRLEYLRFSVPTYLAGAFWERVVNKVSILSPFRAVIIAVLRKPIS